MRSPQWIAEAVALALTVVFAAIYLSTRTAYYSVDAVQTASTLTAFARTHSDAPLLDPAHLLFGPLAESVFATAKACDYRGGPLPVLGALNAICGALGIGLLSLLLRAILTRSRALTVLAPVALGFTFGYWMEATGGRPEMPAAAAALLAAYLLVRAMLLPTIWRVAAAGLATALSCLLHAFAAPLILVGLLAVALAEYTQGSAAEERRARWVNSAAYLVCIAVPVIAVYGICASLIGLHGIHHVAHWLRAGAARTWWWSPHPIDNLRLDAYAFRRALFVEPGTKSGTFHLSRAGATLDAGLYWMALLCWFAAAYAILSAAAFMVRTHYGSFLSTALAAGALYAILFTYVSPGYFVYWVPIVIVSSVVTAICASYYRGRRGGRLWLLGLGCWTAVFAASNYVQFIGPHERSSANPFMVQAMFVERHTKPGDIVIVTGFGDDSAIAAYVPYFADRSVYSIRDGIERHDGNIAEVSSEMSSAVMRSLESGNHAYIYGDLWEDPSIRARFRDDYGVDDLHQLLGDLQRAPAWRDPDHPDVIAWKLLEPTKAGQQYPTD